MFQMFFNWIDKVMKVWTEQSNEDILKITECFDPFEMRDF